MTRKSYGGYAFPVPGGPKDAYGNVVNQPQYGMTLRDWFAGLTLQGMTASPELMQFVTSRAEGGEGVPFERLARQAYRQADAMLKERDQ